ncbi:hypothetical protein GCM10011390_37910 [Aureimonas endophytica]|uniref:Tetratricopeptide repeat protein n=1 Tax=Aureimonas endophytica TaxID=2027858 RepID=A0A916ZWP9_9HYPH|nr:tetratricopeptide repeat protein [Aureimonas endophytica]GGE15232.1 hypothetical protein GCM10011390_37910 [Aureimonas endophytica]
MEAGASFAEWRRLGLAARQDGRRESALAAFREATRLDAAERWNRNDIALELLALGRIDAAEGEARDLLDAAPGFAPAHRTLGLLARRRGEREAALGAFRTAATADPRDLWNRQDAAAECQALGRLDEAEADYRAVAAAGPGAHALRGLGQIARQRGAAEEALVWFEAAARLRPEDPWFALDRIAAFRALGRLAEAGGAARDLATRHSDFLPGLLERADILEASAEREAARTLLARLLVTRPDCGEAYRRLARLALHDGETATAERHLRAALAIGAGDATGAVEIRLELHQLLRRSQGPEAARPLLAEAEATLPDHPRLLLALGDDRRERGHLAEAETFYDRALAARPGFAWALIGKAAIARERGDAEPARRLYAEAIRLDPAEGFAQLELAALLRDGGDWSGAREVLATVPDASPRLRAARMAEGLVRRAAGDWPGAAAAFDAVAARFPDFVEALVEASDDWLRAGRAEEAEARLAEAERRAPDHPALLEALARRALLRDDLADAERCLARVTSLDPARLWPWLALARLRALGGAAAAGLALFDGAEARFGPRPEIALARAELLRQIGAPDEARQAIERARAAFPHHVGLRLAEAGARIEAGEWQAAEALLDAPRSGDGPAEGRRQFHLSLLAAQRWDFAEAIRRGEAAVAALPGDGWPRNRLVHAALLALDLDRAARHLDGLAALEAGASALKGKSANRSQSHYGQLLDEFRLDAEVLADLRTALAHPPGERLARLAAIVRAAPDSTAAAVQFFIERRRAARPARPAPVGSAIPPTIHQYWDEAVPPPDLQAYIASWQTLNAGFEHRLWNAASAREVLHGSPVPGALAAFDRAPEPAMKADLFRLALLFAEGGVYADADDRCLRAIAPLVGPERGFVAYQEDLGSLGNNFVAATPGHPILGRALELAVAAVNRGDADILWLATGPGLLTRAAAESLATRPEIEAGFVLLDRSEFLRFSAIHCLAAYKATERHWSRTAFGRARPQATRARSA